MAFFFNLASEEDKKTESLLKVLSVYSIGSAGDLLAEKVIGK